MISKMKDELLSFRSWSYKASLNKEPETQADYYKKVNCNDPDSVADGGLYNIQVSKLNAA